MSGTPGPSSGPSGGRRGGEAAGDSTRVASAGARGAGRSHGPEALPARPASVPPRGTQAPDPAVLAALDPLAVAASGEMLAPRPAATLDVTVIVPVTSARAEVHEVVPALAHELERAGKTYEFVLVFDGVRGKAWSAAQALVERYGERVRLVSFENPFGESVALSAGFEICHGRVIVTSPQYVQIDPLELPAMLAALDQGADFVTPWRKPRVDALLNRVQSACFNWLIRQIIRMEFHDLNCYFRAIRREVLSEVAIYGDMYRFLPVIAHRQGFRVVEVPVRHLREWGQSGFFGLGVYVRRFLDVLGVMFLTKFTLKPLRFFGSIGALCSFLGAVMLGYVVWQKLTDANQGLYGRPVFLIAIMLLVVGVQIIGFGLVGEIIIYTQARHLREYRVERVYE